jgi:hypothetical protein
MAVGIPKVASHGMGLSWLTSFAGGEGGIRTHGWLPNFGFQDRRDRPLCHLSWLLFLRADVISEVSMREVGDLPSGSLIGCCACVGSVFCLGASCVF